MFLSNVCATITRKYIDAIKARKSLEIENFEVFDGICKQRKSNCHKPDMGLDVVPRNVKQETPIMASGKSEEEGNMAETKPVGRNMDQDQKEGKEEVSDVLATQEAKKFERIYVCAAY